MNFPRVRNVRGPSQRRFARTGFRPSPKKKLSSLCWKIRCSKNRISPSCLERLDLSANVLTAIAEKGKWTASEGVRLRLARHPRTPRRFAMALLRQLYLFDLVRVSLLPSTPAEIRRLAEELMVTRVPQLPIGQKLTLARRGPARVVGALLAEGQPQAIKLALANAFLTESQVLKVLAKPGVPERVVAAIAQHPRWAVQYNVRVALVRNQHTPIPVVLAFLPNLTLRDLKDLAA